MTEERLFRRVAQTSGYAFFGKFGAKLLGLGHWFLLFFLVLEADGFGQFSFLLAYVGIFSGLAEGGVSGILVRQLRQTDDETERRKLFGGSLLLLLLQGTLFWLILVVAYFLIPSFRVLVEPRVVLMYSTVILFAPHSACEGVFRASMQLRVPVYVNLARYGLFLLAINPGGPIDSIAEVVLAWWILMVSGILVVSFLALRKLPPLWKGVMSTSRSLFRDSAPLFFTRLATVFYYRVDQVMLGLFFADRPEHLGWYSSAVRWAEALNLIPAALMEGIYPALSRVWTESRSAFDSVVRRVWLLFVGLAGTVVLLLCLLIPIAMAGEFIEALRPAETPLLLLVIAEGFIFLNLLLFQLLVAAGFQQRLMAVTGTMVVANVLLNLWFFTTFFSGAGHTGAAWSTMLTEALGVGLQICLMRRFLGGTLDRISYLVLCVFVSACCLSLVLYLGLPFNSPLSESLQVVLIVGWLAWTGWLLKDEVKNLPGLFRQ